MGRVLSGGYEDELFCRLGLEARLVFVVNLEDLIGERGRLLDGLCRWDISTRRAGLWATLCVLGKAEGKPAEVPALVMGECDILIFRAGENATHGDNTDVLSAPPRRRAEVRLRSCADAVGKV